MPPYKPHLPCANLSMIGPPPELTTLPSQDYQTTDRGINERDRHAFLYIVIVLLFYSLGIIIAIIMYLKREKQEIIEEKAYEDYMVFRQDPDRHSRSFRVQRMISHLSKVERSQKTVGGLDGVQEESESIQTDDEDPIKLHKHIHKDSLSENQLSHTSSALKPVAMDDIDDALPSTSKEANGSPLSDSVVDSLSGHPCELVVHPGSI